MRAALPWIVATAAGVAFLALDPARTISPAAMGVLLRGGAVAAVALFAALGAGGALLDRVSPTPDRTPEPGRWVRALAAGVGLHTAAMLVLLFAGAVGPLSSAAVTLALAAGWLARPRLDRPRVGVAGLLVGAVLLAPALIDALAPPTDTDEIYYQLAIPRFLLDHAALPGGFLHPDQSRPLPVHLVHAATLALGGEAAPRMWHLGIGIALVLGVRAFAEARFGPGHGDLPALALLGSWSFVRGAGLAYADLAVALWLLVAAEATLAGRWRELGWASGLALAAKYTAAPAVAGLFLVALWDARRTPLAVVRAAALAIVPTAPWWVRNAAAGLHPLFPFAGWPDAKDFVFVYPEKYGAGHGLTDALLLPGRLLFTAEPDSFVFYGRVSLLWLGLGMGALLALRGPHAPVVRRLGIAAALAFVGWAGAAQLLRYLVPAMGIGALLGAALPPRRAWLLLLVASLPANLGPAWSRAAARLPVALGQESADTFLERELPAWPAVRYLRDEVPPDEPVALLNAWAGYWLPQPYVLGSVEDHIPTRHWVWAHGDGAIEALRAEGVRWLLVGDVKYLRKSYRFLPETTFEEQLRAPQRALERLLLRDATRVFRAQHHSVWRLDDPRAVP